MSPYSIDGYIYDMMAKHKVFIPNTENVQGCDEAY